MGIHRTPNKESKTKQAMFCVMDHVFRGLVRVKRVERGKDSHVIVFDAKTSEILNTLTPPPPAHCSSIMDYAVNSAPRLMQSHTEAFFAKEGGLLQQCGRGGGCSMPLCRSVVFEGTHKCAFFVWHALPFHSSPLFLLCGSNMQRCPERS